jgi:hypothetical protein
MRMPAIKRSNRPLPCCRPQEEAVLRMHSLGPPELEARRARSIRYVLHVLHDKESHYPVASSYEGRADTEIVLCDERRTDLEFSCRHRSLIHDRRFCLRRFHRRDRNIARRMHKDAGLTCLSRARDCRSAGTRTGCDGQTFANTMDLCWGERRRQSRRLVLPPLDLEQHGVSAHQHVPVATVCRPVRLGGRGRATMLLPKVAEQSRRLEFGRRALCQVPPRNRGTQDSLVASTAVYGRI